MDATDVARSVDQAVIDAVAIDEPYSFGHPPTTQASFPFTDRQFARLLIVRGRHSSAADNWGLTQRAVRAEAASSVASPLQKHSGRIGGYTLLEPIGQGGMAVVFKARQERLERIVAVKLLSEDLAASSECVARFRREARTAANLSHRNVITVHDFGENEHGVPYLVFEFIEGPTLADLMDSGLDDARIPDLLDELAAGLDYAHSRGVVHRDIKPGNILTTPSGRVVLADFGLAWATEDAHLTVSGGIIGTPEYMSPEQAAGHAIDHRSDVYALGVVLYEMLVGVRPFVAQTQGGVLLKHLQHRAPSLLIARPELPSAVAAVLEKVLAKNPADRYNSAGQLARAFRAAFSGRT